MRMFVLFMTVILLKVTEHKIVQMNINIVQMNINIVQMNINIVQMNKK